ncbi:hypothetical protein HDU98_009157 [Podochytrium sp. JEL0797]|nr:hypothetical protein HDU98_009157 [Podochytrium sp. JEL0797]
MPLCPFCSTNWTSPSKLVAHLQTMKHELATLPSWHCPIALCHVEYAAGHVVSRKTVLDHLKAHVTACPSKRGAAVPVATQPASKAAKLESEGGHGDVSEGEESGRGGFGEMGGIEGGHGVVSEGEESGRGGFGEMGGIEGGHGVVSEGEESGLGGFREEVESEGGHGDVSEGEESGRGGFGEMGGIEGDLGGFSQGDESDEPGLSQPYGIQSVFWSDDEPRVDEEDHEEVEERDDVEDGDEEEEEEEGDAQEEMVLRGCQVGREWPLLSELQSKIDNSPQSKFEFDLYFHCTTYKVTHAEYAALTKLSMPLKDLNRTITMTQDCGSPSTFQTLEKRILKSVTSVLDVKTLEHEVAGKVNKTPFLTIHSACFLWLASPFIRESIQTSVRDHVLPFLSVDNTESVLDARIKTLETYPETYGVDRVEHGAEFLSILRRTIHLWKPAFKRNEGLPLELRREVIVLHLGAYSDDFSWMDKVKASKGQTLFCMAPAQASRAIRGSTKGLGVLPMMLASALGVKQNGMGPLLECYTPELEEFARGVEMTIEGIRFLVFAFVWAYTGDTPARKRILGLNVSVTHTFACGGCMTEYRDFPLAAQDPSKLQPARQASYHQQLLEANGGPGKLSGVSATVAKAQGIEEIPVTCTWPGQNVPESEVPDIMHQEFLGALQTHFLILIKGVQFDNLFPRMNRLFEEYCKLSRIPAEYEFKDPNTLKGLKAFGLKEFFLASPWILMRLGVFEKATADQRREFRYWCFRIRVVGILCLHDISARQFKDMDGFLAEFLRFYGSAHPKDFKFNNHLFQHVPKNLARYGPARDHWCFVNEHLIKVLKSYYGNTNNRNVSVGVFRRHVAVMFLELLNQAKGSGYSCPKKFVLPRSDKTLSPPPNGTFISRESDEEITETLFTHSTGNCVLNWQQLKRDDTILVRVAGDFELGMFFAAATPECGQVCSQMLYRRPLMQSKCEKRMEGSVQWLEYGEEMTDEVFVVDAEESFVRRLKRMKCGENSFVITDIVDDTSALNDLRSLFRDLKSVAALSVFGRSLVIDGMSKHIHNTTWDAIQYPGLKPQEKPVPLDFSHVWQPTFLDIESRAVSTPGSAFKSVTMEVDVVVIGSGAGGGVAAAKLAQAGHKVLVLEKGQHRPFAAQTHSEIESMFNTLEMNGLLQSDDGSISILGGSGFGGGTAINWGCSLRTPHEVRREWSEKHHLPYFESNEFSDALDAVCGRIGVTDQNVIHNGPNRILLEGCQRLGYPSATLPQNKGPHAHQCGFCSMGCPYAEKQGSHITWLKDASDSGAQFIQNCRATRITHSNGHVTGVEAEITTTSTRLTICAKTVISSCGSIQSPLLLARSGLHSRHLGQNLKLHPCAFVQGYFPDRVVDCFDGSIMTAISGVVADREGSGYGARIEVPAVHPGLFATLTPFHSPVAFKRTLLQYRHRATLLVLTRDRDSTARVYEDNNGLTRVDFAVGKFDKASLEEGVVASVRILVAAGAREVECGVPGVKPLTFSEEEMKGDTVASAKLAAYVAQIRATGIVGTQVKLGSAHQMGTCRMSSTAGGGVVDGEGQTWEVKGLYVADASVFPGSSGVNPMVTTMAVGYGVAEGVKRKLAGRAKI